MFARIVEAHRRTRKPKDLLWNRFVARPLAAVFVVPLESTPITPNQVTLFTLVIFVAAAAIIAFMPGWSGLLLGVGVLELAYVFDCVDGQLARLRGTSTPVGAHLDFLMDELKAFLLVTAVAVRLYHADGKPLWLIEGLVTLLAVASAISLTTFVRRPEYAAATGAAVKQGSGDYGAGFAAAPPPGSRLSPKRLLDMLGGFIAHYPSHLVFVALANRIDIFLHAYLLVHVGHAARSLLAITWKLGRRPSS